MSKKPSWEAACNHSDTCALTGSAAFFMSIPGTSVLVNGPLWCYFYALRYMENAVGNLSDRMFCTQPAGTAVVYGTEEDLLKGFETVQKTKMPERLFIENNCSISMIGDDLQGIAGRANLPFPVYTLDSGGIHGGFAGGWSRACLRAIEDMKEGETIPRSVNLLGMTPFLLKGREDATEITRLLGLCGISVLSMPGGGSDWGSIMEAPRAALNIVLRDELGGKAAETMKKRFGIPYISLGLPYGIEGTKRWLAEVLSVLGGTMDPVEAEIRDRGSWMQRLGSDMESLWGPLWFDRILIAGGPSEVSGMAEAVRGEWADTETLTAQLQLPTEKEIPAADQVLTAGIDDVALNETYENWQGGLLMGSAHEASRMIRLKKPFFSCNIAYPTYTEMFLTDQPFCGLRGAAFLYERLWNVKLQSRIKERC